MGENFENKRKNPNEMEISVSVDRSLEVEAIRAEKDSEIAELKSALATIAEKGT